MKLKKFISMALALSVMLSMLMLSQFGASAQIQVSGNFEYEMYGENTVKIVGYRGAATEKLTIPSKIKDYKVEVIGTEAFYQKEVYEVVLPDTLKIIEDYAFFNSAIMKVNIPKNVKEIGVGAFAAPLFESYTVSKDNKNFDAKDGVLFTEGGDTLFAYPAARTNETYKVPANTEKIGAYAFYSSLELKTVETVSSVKSIEEGAFLYSSLEKIVFAEGLESIGEYAFTDCLYLRSAKFPASLKNIGYWAFEGCSSLNNFEISDNNPEFSVIDGVLFSKDKKILLLYPSTNSRENGVYNVPEGTETIAEIAFAFANLRTINIADSVVTIDSGAFYESKIITVNIGKGVEYIGYDIFYNCSQLRQVNAEDGCTLFSLYDFYIKDEYETQLYKNCSAGVVYMNKSAIGFKYVSKVPTMIKIYNTALSIANFAFYGIETVEKVEIAEGVTKIGHHAFADCTSLKEITIPASVMEFGHASVGFLTDIDSEGNEVYKSMEDFVIKGYTNSMAESYADANGFEFVSIGEVENESYLLGDLDCDQKITIKDATIIQKYLVKMVGITTQDKINADFNEDGTIDIKDATAIQKSLVGLPY